VSSSDGEREYKWGKEERGKKGEKKLEKK